MKKRLNEKNKNILLGFFIGAITVLMIFGIIYYFNQEVPESSKEDIIATVNGEEITQNQVKQIQEDLLEQGQKITEKQAVNQIIDITLLSDKAEKEGYSLSKQEVEETLGLQLAQQGRSLEDIKQEIETQGMDYEKLIEDYRKQISIQEYIDNLLEKEINVNESEIKEFYEQNKQFLGENESFEDVEEELKQFLEQQKQQQIVMNLIQDLRENAEIEYLKEFEEPEQPQIQFNQQATQENQGQQIEVQGI